MYRFDRTESMCLPIRRFDWIHGRRYGERKKHGAGRGGSGYPESIRRSQFFQQYRGSIETRRRRQRHSQDNNFRR